MRREIIPYNPRLKEPAKKLRQNMTLSEVLLWDQLKQKKMKGYDFDRQKPLNEFIVDFYCKDLKLAIEVDGDSHNHEEAYKADEKRQKILENLGVTFLRFDDLEVKKDINKVIHTIEFWIEEFEEQKGEPTSTSPNWELDLAKIKNSVTDNSGLVHYDGLVASSEGLGVGCSEPNLQNLLERAKKAALAAGADILKIYESDEFSVESKADDSPLTRADKAAHNRIVFFLEKTNLPILSEEGRNIPFNERSKWDYFWMVDPLDGTKEFIKRNGEFTVNIALIHHHECILGVVYTPVSDELYWAVKGQGAHQLIDGQNVRLMTSKKGHRESHLKVVASRSHMSEETERFVARLDTPEVVSKGSSLKFLLVASGEADIYPRFGPTMEWDTAAAHVIVSEAGGRVVLEDEKTPLSYNKESLLNPSFIVFSK